MQRTQTQTQTQTPTPTSTSKPKPKKKAFWDSIIADRYILNEYDLELMSTVSDINKDAEIGKIYLQEDGSYVVCDFKGELHQGKIDTNTINLQSLDQKIKNSELKEKILEAITNARDIPPSEYEKTLEQLIAGQLKSLDFDLKYGKNNLRVYSIRTSQTDRLLLVPTEIDGENCCIIAEEIFNHAYKDSIVLNSPDITVNEILKNMRSPCKLSIDPENKEQEKLSKEEIWKLSGNYIAPELWHDKWFDFNDEQNGVFEFQLPLAVFGPPGSGKTCLAYKLLCQSAIKENEHDQDETILYVAENEKLVNEIKEMWDKNGIDPKLKQKVVITTNKELKRELSKTEEADWQRRVVSESYFEKWLTDGQKKALLRLWKNKVPDSINSIHANLNRIYQEFRIISGYLQDRGYDEYMALGEKHSNFSKSERPYLYFLYQEYQKYLANEKKIDVAFFKINNKELFDKIIVDEAQDFSHGELNEFLELAKADKQVCYFHDGNQSCKDDISKAHYIKKKLLNIKKRKELCVYKLPPRSHRSSPEIVKFCNQALLPAKFIVTGGKGDKDENSVIEDANQEEAGKVLWFETEDKDLSKTNIPKNLVVIIFNPLDRENAKQLFGTSLVFTPKEYKGLETDTIVLYKPLDNKLFHQIDSKFTEENIRKFENKKEIHLSKKGKSQAHFGPAFNEFYTSCMRAKKNLIIVQPKSHKTPLLENYLKTRGGVRITKDYLSEGVEIEQQQITYDEMIANGNIRQAIDYLLDEQKKSNITIDINQKLTDSIIEKLKNDQKDLAEKIWWEGLNKNPKLEKDQNELLKLKETYLPKTESQIASILENEVEKKKKKEEEDKKEEERKNLSQSKQGQRKQNVRGIQEERKQESGKKQVGRGQGVLSKVTKNGNALFTAAKNGKLSEVKSLLRDPDTEVNYTHESGITPLLIALENGHTNIVKLLLNRKDIDVNKEDKRSGTTPLILASHKGYVDIIKLLLSHNDIQVNQADYNSGLTALIVAAEGGRKEIVRLLLNHNDIEINKPNNGSVTALLYASGKGYTEIVKLLLNHKDISNNSDIHVNQADNLGNTPLIMALQKPGNTDIVKLLLAHPGIEINQINKAGSTPILLASQIGPTSNVQSLIEKGASVNLPMKAFTLILIKEAERKGKQKIFELVLKQRNNNNVPSHLPNFTPLHAAIFFGHEDIVKVLLDNHANVNAITGGLSCLELANIMKNERIISLIKKRIEEQQKQQKDQELLNYAQGLLERFQKVPYLKENYAKITLEKMEQMFKNDEITAITDYIIQDCHSLLPDLIEKIVINKSFMKKENLNKDLNPLILSMLTTLLLNNKYAYSKNFCYVLISQIMHQKNNELAITLTKLNDKHYFITLEKKGCNPVVIDPILNLCKPFKAYLHSEELKTHMRAITNNPNWNPDKDSSYEDIKFEDYSDSVDKMQARIEKLYDELGSDTDVSKIHYAHDYAFKIQTKVLTEFDKTELFFHVANLYSLRGESDENIDCLWDNIFESNVLENNLTELAITNPELARSTLQKRSVITTTTTTTTTKNTDAPVKITSNSNLPEVPKAGNKQEQPSSQETTHKKLEDEIAELVKTFPSGTTVLNNIKQEKYGAALRTACNNKDGPPFVEIILNYTKLLSIDVFEMNNAGYSAFNLVLEKLDNQNITQTDKKQFQKILELLEKSVVNDVENKVKMFLNKLNNPGITQTAKQNYVMMLTLIEVSVVNFLENQLQDQRMDITELEKIIQLVGSKVDDPNIDKAEKEIYREIQKLLLNSFANKFKDPESNGSKKLIELVKVELRKPKISKFYFGLLDKLAVVLNEAQLSNDPIKKNNSYKIAQTYIDFSEEILKNPTISEKMKNHFKEFKEDLQNYLKSEPLSKSIAIRRDILSQASNTTLFPPNPSQDKTKESPRKENRK